MPRTARFRHAARPHLHPHSDEPDWFGPFGTAFASGRLSAEEAWTAAHVDEDWQIEHWGTDEEAFRRRENRWQEMQATAAVLDALR